MPAQHPRKNRFRISAVDRRGRPLAPEVVEAAELIGYRALQYAERFVSDPAVAANLLDEAVATVSRVVRSRREPIRDLQAYLFRALLRRISRATPRALTLAHPAEPDPATHFDSDLESRILINELLSHCDSVIRDMFIRRIQGFTWKEIANVFGISAHAAESRYSQALRRVGRKLGLRA